MFFPLSWAFSVDRESLQDLQSSQHFWRLKKALRHKHFSPAPWQVPVSQSWRNWLITDREDCAYHRNATGTQTSLSSFWKTCSSHTYVYSIQLWGPPCRKGMNLLEQVQRSSMVEEGTDSPDFSDSNFHNNFLKHVFMHFCRVVVNQSPVQALKKTKRMWLQK